MINNLFFIISLIWFIAIIQPSEGKFYKDIYHTTSEIFSRLDFLSNGPCQGILKRKTSFDKLNQLVYYTIDSPTPGKKQPVYILFGEHSRELISPELGLFMIETLCKQNNKYSKMTISKILEQNSFLIVPIVNVPGKIAVENGNTCKRTNENNVDLNRNWDIHFKFTNSEDTASGEFAFSEWQTRILNKLLIDFKAKVFISVHSGALGMYTPPAYKMIDMKNLTDEKFQKVKKLIKILNVLNEKYCQCEAGPAANQLLYECPGNCMDYAYEKQSIPYSFAFEIFTNQHGNKAFLDIINSSNPAIFDYNEFITKFKNTDMSTLFIQKSSKLRGSFLQIDDLAVEKIKTHDHNHNHENTQFSCFSQTSTTYPHTEEFCMNQFNPLTHQHKDNTVINWTNVIFELLSLIYQIEK